MRGGGRTPSTAGARRPGDRQCPASPLEPPKGTSRTTEATALRPRASTADDRDGAERSPRLDTAGAGVERKETHQRRSVHALRRRSACRATDRGRRHVVAADQETFVVTLAFGIPGETPIPPTREATVTDTARLRAEPSTDTGSQAIDDLARSTFWLDPLGASVPLTRGVIGSRGGGFVTGEEEVRSCRKGSRSVVVSERRKPTSVALSVNLLEGSSIHFDRNLALPRLTRGQELALAVILRWGMALRGIGRRCGRIGRDGPRPRGRTRVRREPRSNSGPPAGLHPRSEKRRSPRHNAPPTRAGRWLVVRWNAVWPEAGRSARAFGLAFGLASGRRQTVSPAALRRV